MANTFTPYATSEEVRDVVKRFESCEFGPDEFHHSHHLTVAVCYLLESTEEEAIGRIRTGLKKFLERHGRPDAYHETITVFWIKRVRRLVDLANKSGPLVEVANSVIAQCSNVRLIDSYFSVERLASQEARQKWCEPDLQRLGAETL